MQPVIKKDPTNLIEPIHRRQKRVKNHTITLQRRVRQHDRPKGDLKNKHYRSSLAFVRQKHRPCDIIIGCWSVWAL